MRSRGALAGPPMAVAAVLAAAILVVGRALLWSAHRPAPPAPELPIASESDGYLSSDACLACHPAEYQSWRRTFHRTMTQVVSPSTVRADFDDVTLSDRGRTLRLARRGDDFLVEMVDPDRDFFAAQRGDIEAGADLAPRTWNPVVMSTGSHYQQTYWVPIKASRGLLQIGWSWLIEEQRWVPREDLFLTPPSEARMPTSWNLLCVRCHATAGRPSEPLVPGRIGSEVGELGIACEACHGPAAEHVRLNHNPLRRFGLHAKDEGDPSMVNPARLAHDRSSMVCGRCHSVSELLRPRDWWQQGDPYRPGDELAESRELLGHEPGGGDYQNAFWGDGTYKAGGREFSGMRLSRCFTQGELSCLSCHSMHSAPPDKQVSSGMEGDGACLQCHQALRAAPIAHTHHPVESEGGRCQNCHMPYTSYALFKGIRSHRIDSPTVATSTLFGRPNACNLCHLDRTLEWTASKLAEWYGQEPIGIGEDERTVAAGLLWMLKGDPSQRVIAAWAAGWPPARAAAGSEWSVPALAQLLDDPYAAIRRVSTRSLRALGEPLTGHDPLAPPAARAAARAATLARWQSRARPGPAHPERLLGADGRLLEERFQALLAARNNRPITIDE